MIDGFLIGVIATASVVAGVFFLRFWRDTRDSLFLCFGLAFLIEGMNRTVALGMTHPSEGRPVIYIIRCFAFLLILAGIISKNRQGSTRL